MENVTTQWLLNWVSTVEATFHLDTEGLKNKSSFQLIAKHKFWVQKIQKKTKKGKISYKAIDKPARKKWCIAKTLDIMAIETDFNAMSPNNQF